MTLYEALESTGNVIRNSCLGKQILEVGSGSGLLGRPLEKIASTALLTDLPKCIDNCRYNISENCSGATVSCRALDVSNPEELDAARWWSFDVLLGADVCYDPELVVLMVHSFKELLRGQRHRIGYMLSTRRSDETYSKLCESLRHCNDVLIVTDITSEAKHHLNKFPYSFWDYQGVVVHRMVSQ